MLFIYSSNFVCNRKHDDQAFERATCLTTDATSHQKSRDGDLNQILYTPDSRPVPSFVSIHESPSHRDVFSIYAVVRLLEASPKFGSLVAMLHPSSPSIDQKSIIQRYLGILGVFSAAMSAASTPIGW